tara:strand:+ start:1074 stop:2615 length:1542 start_codon:yes stop_codon:yes gene_type:complete
VKKLWIIALIVIDFISAVQAANFKIMTGAELKDNQTLLNTDSLDPLDTLIERFLRSKTSLFPKEVLEQILERYQEKSTPLKVRLRLLSLLTIQYKRSPRSLGAYSTFLARNVLDVSGFLKVDGKLIEISTENFIRDPGIQLSLIEGYADQTEGQYLPYTKKTREFYPEKAIVAVNELIRSKLQKLIQSPLVGERKRVKNAIPLIYWMMKFNRELTHESLLQMLAVYCVEAFQQKDFFSFTLWTSYLLSQPHLEIKIFRWLGQLDLNQWISISPGLYTKFRAKWVHSDPLNRLLKIEYLKDMTDLQLGVDSHEWRLLSQTSFHQWETIEKKKWLLYLEDPDFFKKVEVASLKKPYFEKYGFSSESPTKIEFKNYFFRALAKNSFYKVAFLRYVREFPLANLHLYFGDDFSEELSGWVMELYSKEPVTESEKRLSYEVLLTVNHLESRQFDLESQIGNTKIGIQEGDLLPDFTRYTIQEKEGGSDSSSPSLSCEFQFRGRQKPLTRLKLKKIPKR